MTPALAMAQVSKRFGAVQAVDGVDLEVAPGSVHALLGENGAGKSTLMHIAFGMVAADAGALTVRGQPTEIRSPRDARRAGIGMVHQHFASVETMTVRENLELATGRLGVGDESRELLAVAGLELDPNARVEDLSVAMHQRLEISKALATGARILLLDEPTAVLAPAESDELLAVMRRFADGGGSVVLITHKLREVFAVADRVTVLRAGRVVLDGTVRGRTPDELAAAMVGGADVRVDRGAIIGMPGPHRVATGASPTRPEAPAVVQGPGFAVRPGEIVGMAAVEGNGQRSLLRAVAGLEEHPGIVVEGAVAFVPEDRTTEGLIPGLTLTENVVLGLGEDAPWVRGFLVDWRAARTSTRTLLERHDVRSSGPDALARSLSGGNQQKVVMGRAFRRRPQVLVAENPTRGLDIRATEMVHARLREAAASGVAVLVWSSDLDEVLELADRVVVVHAGVVAEAPAGANRNQVGRMMLGLAGRSVKMSTPDGDDA